MQMMAQIAVSGAHVGDNTASDGEIVTSDMHPEIEDQYMSMHHIQWTNLRLLY